MRHFFSTCTILLSIFMLLVAIGFNLRLYRAEPTAMVDPNDNAFQYALVARTNEIWDWAKKTCPKNLSHAHCLLSYLIDHWVPNWAEGYNLPYYYSHAPQIVIVGTYRLLTAISYQLSAISLFEYYHWIIYLLLCLFPLSVFLSIRLLKLPWLTAGVGALLATQISTDGLYGLDPSSFLWRGWGLSSQLFSAIFLPLALASIIRWVWENEAETQKLGARKIHLSTIYYLLSTMFITLTTMGHLGMGLMLFLAIPVVTFTKPILTLLKNQSAGWRISLEEIRDACIQTAFLAIPPLVLLSYWILPTVLNGQYHNISFWDPVWKFNSYGGKEIIINLTNGDLFDFGRLPLYTALVFIGFFVCLLNRQGQKTMSKGQQNMSHAHCPMSFELPALSFLFLFFLLLYFGRTTWGTILNIIPGMNEFHQHRFIVGIHLMGLFLAPIGFTYIVCFIMELFNKLQASSFKLQALYLCLFTSLSLGLFLFLSPQTLKYGQYNDELIQKANAMYLTQKSDADLLIQTLETLPPGRVFAGRGGGWGKSFRVAETPYYMYLSTFGIPTVLWLPQTWSLNSDTEQYFSEDNQSHYDLYTIRYVVAPPDQKPQSFWTLLKETKSWKLYGIDIRQEDNKTERQEQNNSQFVIPASPAGGRNSPIDNYITVGTAPAVVFSDKLSFGNVIRLWIQSEYPKKQLFPELRLTNHPTSTLCRLTPLPCFSMLDEATYQTPASTSASSPRLGEAGLGGPEGETHSLFAQPPKYMTPWEWPEAFASITNDQLRITNYELNQSAMRNPQSNNLPISITNQSSDHDMVFRATVNVASPTSAIRPLSSVSCPTCIVVLKQTYHPNWKATVNGKKVNTIQVFPSFIAIRLEQPGEYDVVFSYHPSQLKQLLFFGTIIGFSLVGGIVAYRRFFHRILKR